VLSIGVIIIATIGTKHTRHPVVTSSIVDSMPAVQYSRCYSGGGRKQHAWSVNKDILHHGWWVARRRSVGALLLLLVL
jgi:hypothetical protein